MTDSLITAADDIHAAMDNLTGAARNMLPLDDVEDLQAALRSAVDAFEDNAGDAIDDGRDPFPLVAVASSGRGIARDLIVRSAEFASTPSAEAALDLVDRTAELVRYMIALPELQKATAPDKVPA